MNLESIFHFCQSLNGSLCYPHEEERELFVRLVGTDGERHLLFLWPSRLVLKIHFSL